MLSPRLASLCGRLRGGRILTLDSLQKKGWVLANRCFLCQKYGKSIDHLLLHCERTREM